MSKNKITVYEVSKLKYELENNIKELIREFQDRTNTNVTGVDLRCRRWVTGKTSVDSVNLDVEIRRYTEFTEEDLRWAEEQIDNHPEWNEL